MKKIIAICLAISVLLSLSVLPVGGAWADPGTQIKIATRTALGHPGTAFTWKGPFKSQQYTTLTGILRPVEAGKKRYAIIIGSNYSAVLNDTTIAPFIPPFAPHLQYAENDAWTMAGLLQMMYGFDVVIPLVGPEASRANILNTIKQVKRLAKDGDEVVFYFAGHGAQQLKSLYGRGWGVASEGIVTDEGTKVDFIWDKDLDKAFQGFDTRRIVFIFDSCLSGGMTELAGLGRMVLMATSKDGISAEAGEMPDPNTGETWVINHGLFTYFLLGALSEAPGADMNQDGTVCVEEAFNYASAVLIQLSPLIEGGIAYYFGDDIASHWGTPVINDWFVGDLQL